MATTNPCHGTQHTRIIFDVAYGRSNVPQDLDFDFSERKIKSLWTILDQTVLSSPIDELEPKHHMGYFFEQKMHDWDVSDGKLFYYSRCGEIGDPAKILVEFE